MKAAHELDPRPEEAWFGRSIDELADLRALVLEAGYSQAIANGLVGLIVGGRASQEVTGSPTTLAQYRKVLRDLAPDGPPRRRRRATAGRQRGATVIEFAGAGAASGVLGLAAGMQQSPYAALSLIGAAVLPIIHAEESYVTLGAAQRLDELPVAA